MLNVDELKFRQWVGLTQQQYDIVKIIYKLRNRGLQTTPKNIQREYRQEHDKTIIKPNLFNLLRTLQQKKVILKSGLADYNLDQPGIMEALESTKNQLSQDLEEVDKTRTQTDQFFKEITYRKEQPDIKYLEGAELYQTLAESLDKSDHFYINEDFPTIAYNRDLAATLQREPYAEALWRAIKNKKPHIHILTVLNGDTLFNHAFRTYGDPKNAFRESANAIDRLQTQIETKKNIEVRYTDTPPGLDVAIITQKEPVEFIIFTRDEHDDLQGGIKIRSHKTAANALRTFQHAYDYATPLTTPVGQQTLQKTKQNTKQKYGILGE